MFFRGSSGKAGCFFLLWVSFSFDLCLFFAAGLFTARGFQSTTVHFLDAELWWLVSSKKAEDVWSWARVRLARVTLQANRTSPFGSKLTG